jgi:PAS domain S-box-containing protein
VGELTHRSPDSLVGKHIWDEFPDAVGTDTYHAFNKAMQEQQYMVNTDYFEPLDLWQENHIYPSENGLSVFIRDITQKKKAEQQINDVYNEMHTALNSITDGVISVDNDFRYTFINDAALANAKKTREEMLGKTLLEVRPELEHTRFWKKYQEIMRKKIVGEIEGFFSPMNILASVKIYPSKNGLTFFYKDVTEERKIQDALVASEKKYRLLFDNNPLPMWMIDIHTLNIIDVNEAAIEHYGYTRNEFLSMNIRDIRPPEDIARVEAAANQQNSSIRKVGVWTHLKKDGTQIKVEITSHDINYLDHKTRLILSNDVTDKVLIEDALLKLNGELRQLYTRQQNIREEERKHIAREIHDELGQLITGLKMDISWLKQRIIQKQPELTEKLNESISLLDESVKTIRKISSELRPGILDDLGIIPALFWLAKDFEKRTQIKCKINNLAGDSIECGDEVKVVLFRVFQEALTNVMRHANATEITTEILQEKSQLTMQIADNGKGYDVTKQTKTLGILGMKERIANVNGELYISSALGRGTSITIIISI